MRQELITALGPDDPDDGDEGRRQRGLATQTGNRPGTLAAKRTGP